MKCHALILGSNWSLIANERAELATPTTLGMTTTNIDQETTAQQVSNAATSRGIQVQFALLN
jgi:hypothetical protein